MNRAALVEIEAKYGETYHIPASHLAVMTMCNRQFVDTPQLQSTSRDVRRSIERMNKGPNQGYAERMVATKERLKKKLEAKQ